MNVTQDERLLILQKANAALQLFLNKPDCRVYGPVSIGSDSKSKTGYCIKFEDTDPTFFDLRKYSNQLKEIGFIDVSINYKLLGGLALVICDSLENIIEKLAQQQLTQNSTPAPQTSALSKPSHRKP